MSPWPGPTLEDFVIVELGVTMSPPMFQHRNHTALTPEEFSALVDLFAPHRDAIERHLRLYDEAGGEYAYGDWEEYRHTVMWDIIPMETWDAAAAYLASLRAVHA